MLGGPVEQLPADWTQLPGQWIGVDRGTLHLLQHGITPLFAVGDFDSLTDEEFAQVRAQVPKLHQAPAEKDDTDTELAVKLALVQPQVTAVTLVGATGGRLDHLLANLFIPTQPRFQQDAAKLHLVDAANWVDFYPAGRWQITPRQGYRYIGFVPLTAVTALSISGAKYALTDWSSQTPYAWASNEFVGARPITIQWQQGVVAAIYSRDARGQQTDN